MKYKMSEDIFKLKIANGFSDVTSPVTSRSSATLAALVVILKNKIPEPNFNIKLGRLSYNRFVVTF